MKNLKTFLPLLALLLACNATAQKQVYELWFTVGQVRHHGLLLAGEGSGDWVLRIKYRDVASGAIRLIEQPMHAEQTRLGLCLRGKQVWDVQRQRPATDYAADNFYFIYGKDHRLYPQNLDTQGASSAFTVELLNDPGICDARLEEFGWPAQRRSARLTK